MRIVQWLALAWCVTVTAQTPAQEAPRATVDAVAASPATAEAFERIGDYLWEESPLGPRLTGLLALVTAREMNLAYEWSVREPAAVQAGLDPATIDVVRRDGALAGLMRDEALLVDFGRQLFRARHVDSATFAAVADRFGRRGAFDAMMVLGHGAMAGILQRAADLRPPAGWSAERLPPLAGVGTPAGQPGSFIELGERPPLASDVHEDSLYRFPLLRREQLDAEGRQIFDRFVGVDRETTPRGPVGMTFSSPALVEPVQQLNSALRETGALDTRMVEIVIATTGREMNSQYQWNVHGGAAERAGAGTAVLDAIRDDRDLGELDDRDAAAIRFTRELFREERVRPETRSAALRHFGERGVAEIAALAGDYLMMTTVYNALGMRLRPDQAATLPHRAGAPVGAEWR